MKKHTLVFAIAASLALPTLSADETPLAEKMEALDDAYKGFRRETDTTKGAAEARKAQLAVIASLAETPEMLAKMSDGPAKAKASAAYRKLMGELYVVLCEVEQAFLDDKADTVPDLVDRLKKIKKAGHTDFMEDE